MSSFYVIRVVKSRAKWMLCFGRIFHFIQKFCRYEFCTVKEVILYNLIVEPDSRSTAFRCILTGRSSGDMMMTMVGRFLRDTNFQIKQLSLTDISYTRHLFTRDGMKRTNWKGVRLNITELGRLSFACCY